MKQSELLRKQADMIDLAEKHGIDDCRKLIKIKFGGVCYQVADKELYSDQQYQFALGVVEGRPVFEGDELYDRDGKKHKANDYCTVTNQFKCEDTVWRNLYLNPPKPKTVMVEFLVDDAEFLVSDKVRFCCKHGENIQSTVRKALESIKQS